MPSVLPWHTLCNPPARSLLAATLTHWVSALWPTAASMRLDYAHQSKHPLNCPVPDSVISLHLQSSLAVLQPLDQPVLWNHIDLSGIPFLSTMLLGILSGEDGVACALQCPQTHAPTLPPLFVPGVTCLSRVMATHCSILVLM